MVLQLYFHVGKLFSVGQVVSIFIFADAAISQFRLVSGKQPSTMHKRACAWLGSHRTSLWTLKFEFHRISIYHKIICSLEFFFQPFKTVNTILSLHKEGRGLDLACRWCLADRSRMLLLGRGDSILQSRPLPETFLMTKRASDLFKLYIFMYKLSQMAKFL